MTSPVLRSSDLCEEKARGEGYAVPAFNTNGGSYDITRAAVEAAEELSSPLILQTYENNLPYRGCGHSARIAELFAQEATIPIALQLDHGHSPDSCRAALAAGYTCVMIDGSGMPFDENVRVTRQALAIAREAKAALEGEIGHIAIRRADGQVSAAPKTDVQEAREFVKQTGVDFLAVAIGTTHGLFESQTDIDFDLLRVLRESVGVPLVLHGTGGVPLDLLSKCVSSGIAKANFGEVFRAPYIRHFVELSQTMDHRGHPWRIMRAVKDRLKDDMKELIRVLGAEGKGK